MDEKGNAARQAAIAKRHLAEMPEWLKKAESGRKRRNEPVNSYEVQIIADDGAVFWSATQGAASAEEAAVISMLQALPPSGEPVTVAVRVPGYPVSILFRLVLD